MESLQLNTILSLYEGMSQETHTFNKIQLQHGKTEALQDINNHLYWANAHPVL